MKRVLQECSLVALSVLLSGAPAWAQLSTAQLSGRVTDESGAVLPGVSVTVTQTDTGFTRSDVTDGDGAYVMSNLPPGPYRLEVMLQGFRTYVQTGIVLQVAAAPASTIRSVTWRPCSGSSRMSSLETTELMPALRTSTSGAAASTVTDSSREPRPSTALIVGVPPTCSTMPVCT